MTDGHRAGAPVEETLPPRDARIDQDGRAGRDGVTERGGGTERGARTARGARNRARLLAAAEQVFTELGYHEASIVKVVQAAGVAPGTFYLYFSSKRDIFDELVEDLNHRVRHAMTEAASAHGCRAEAD